ncbi:MAG: DNA repair protein RecN [Clostridia bacterium]
MILSLHIKNIALISSLDIELSEGLNVLSGETGAGKSIIIDSLNFVLGDRADRSLIRHGEDSASVQVVFSGKLSPEAEEVFASVGIEKDEVVIIKRTMTTAGRSECRVNGTLINLSLLREIVTLLVDIHSQHEHQTLLTEQNHIKILDRYSRDIAELKERFRIGLGVYKAALLELESFPPEDERERQADILKFQMDEINRVAVEEGEEEQLIREREKVYNSQKIISSLSSAVNGLKGEDSFLGAMPALHTAIKDIRAVSGYIPALEELAERLESAKIEVDDIAFALSDELENISLDPYEAERVEKRIDEVRSIKKRFGKTVAAIKEFYNKTEAEYQRLIGAGERTEELKKQIAKEGGALVRLARLLHAKREVAAANFEDAIINNLSELGMPNITFKAEINFPNTDAEILSSLTDDGGDTVRFLISPNKGEPLKSLVKIASGGEMSRFMLGLKNITAELDGIGTLVFDEIDTGISGNIAKVVTQKLYDIAKARQVIAVTHLPQLASMADTHYLITKSEQGGKTLTFVNLLDNENSLKEIMRLAGSAEGSAVGLESARELKEWANRYKSK